MGIQKSRFANIGRTRHSTADLLRVEKAAELFNRGRELQAIRNRLRKLVRSTGAFVHLDLQIAGLRSFGLGRSGDTNLTRDSLFLASTWTLLKMTARKFCDVRKRKLSLANPLSKDSTSLLTFRGPDRTPFHSLTCHAPSDRVSGAHARNGAHGPQQS